MGQYDFDYEIPENFNIKFAGFLQQNGEGEIGKHIRNCNVDIDDVGLAYYAGLRDDNWDKHAVDVTVVGADDDVSYLKTTKAVLKDRMQKFLRPSKSGLLIRNIDFMISDSSFDISLPDETEESFDTLSSDIQDAIRKNEPTLVLDRLHTYSVRYIRKLCNAHAIPITDDRGKKHALHSLVGMLVKRYRDENVFQSDFVNQSLKMSISVFERFNAIRNDQSYAHDNEVLNNAEATYVISVITATLQLFRDIESQSGKRSIDTLKIQRADTDYFSSEGLFSLGLCEL